VCVDFRKLVRQEKFNSTERINKYTEGQLDNTAVRVTAENNRDTDVQTHG
jgi:hypothetical protein